MKKIIFSFDKERRLGTDFCDNYALWVLSYFLSTFRGNDNFMNWIKDHLNKYSGIETEVKEVCNGNTEFKKINNNLQMHAEWESCYDNDPDNYSLLIPIDQFVYITEKWLKLKKLNMPYIIITEENNKYKIEALDELTPEDQLLVDNDSD